MRDPRAVLLDPREAAVAVLAQHETPLEVQRQPVRAALPVRLQFRQEDGVEEDARSVRLGPAVDGVGGDVAEEQVPVVRTAHPDRPLDKLEAVGHLLDHRVGRQQLVQPGIEPLDGARGLGGGRLRLGGRRLFGRPAGKDGSENQSGANLRCSMHDSSPRPSFRLRAGAGPWHRGALSTRRLPAASRALPPDTRRGVCPCGHSAQRAAP